jgi:nucleoside-diphosphate-sugar epimerase
VVGDGSIRRDFTHVSDVVAGNLAAASAQGRLNGEAFNLGAGDNVAIRDVAEAILKAHGRSWETHVENLPPRPNEPAVTLADRAKSLRMLGWEPKMKFSQGLAELIPVFETAS